MSKQSEIAWAITFAAAAISFVLLRRSKSNPPSLINENGMKNYFGNSEFTNSSTAKKLGIDNTPSDAVWYRIYALRDNVLNPAREQLGRAIYITSGYRSLALNSALGGVSNSQHMTGEAVDITTKSLTLNRELFAILAQMGNFDQLIWEKGGEWIHVSYRSSGNRNEMLAYNGTSYTRINNDWQTAIA